jgi:hypothetical protein
MGKRRAYHELKFLSSLKPICGQKHKTSTRKKEGKRTANSKSEKALQAKFYLQRPLGIESVGHWMYSILLLPALLFKPVKVFPFLKVVVQMTSP